MKYAIRSALLSIAINAGFLYLMNDALAADYYKIGIGQTTMQNNASDGWWQQDGVQDTRSGDSPSWEIGAGWKLSDNFDFEIGYRDLGKHTEFGNWLSDIDYALLKAGKCTIPCSGLWTAYSESKTYGATLKIKYSHDLEFMRLPDLRMTGAVGIFAFHSTSSFYDLGAPGKLNQVLHESENHQRPYIAVGLEYKNVFLEYTMHSSVGTENSPVEKAHTLHFGVIF